MAGNENGEGGKTQMGPVNKVGNSDIYPINNNEQLKIFKQKKKMNGHHYFFRKTNYVIM